jgi:Ni,Fe-hydrogenase III large subunit
VSGLQATLVVPTSAITQTSLHELAVKCSARLRAGARLVTLFARLDVGERVMITAVLLTADGSLSLLQGQGRRGESYPSLTPKHPSAHMFEREIWEQTGILPAGHPWLKPVRFERERRKKMREYPFFSVQGKEVHEVGVGPIHAGVIEPGHFRFMCLGETVYHLEIQLGYQHRGVEELLLARDPRSLTPLVETIAGDSSVAYAWAYCAAFEALADLHVPLQVQAIRGVALELERIAMHLAGLAGLSSDIAFLQGAATYGRLRTAVINASMRICGSRFGRGWLRPGGVVSGISRELRGDLRNTLRALQRDFEQVNELVLNARTVRDRFQGVGAVSRVAAEEIGLLGPAARACGVNRDARSRLPGELWDAVPIEAKVEETGDCWARMKLRMTEVAESARWLNDVLDRDWDLDVRRASASSSLRANSLCVSLCEGFRGEVVHVLETDGDARLRHYKVQDPSLQNWFGLALAVRGAEISDFPICNKSFDLSYCGNDL